MEKRFIDANEIEKYVSEYSQIHGCNWIDNSVLYKKIKSMQSVLTIPENPTNGDMIKALFPNVLSRLDERTGMTVTQWEDGTSKCFKTDWWNAPFKKGE